MILVLPTSGYSLQDLCLEYVALGIMFVGFFIGNMIIVNGSHNCKYKLVGFIQKLETLLEI
jgi:hypothetical protein